MSIEVLTAKIGELEQVIKSKDDDHLQKEERLQSAMLHEIGRVQGLEEQIKVLQN